MTGYLFLKYVHVGSALLSISGFLVRWAWMASGSALLQHRRTRRLPHVVDTLFLLSGLALAATIQQYPFVDAWLTAKVLALVAYIVLGALALKYAPGLMWKTVCLCLALIAFVYIIGVARTWSPSSWLMFL